jgi:hypothetical protein
MGYTTESQGQAIKPVTAVSAIEAFDPIFNRLGSLVDKVGHCADRVTGSRPSGVDPSKDAPPPSHLIAQIQERRARLLSLVDHLESEVQRLDIGLS